MKTESKNVNYGIDIRLENLLAGKKILVTGGAGAIGTFLVRALVKNNKVIVIDDLSSGNSKNLPRHKNLRFIKGTILNNNILLDALSKKIDAIFHLAAHFANQNSVEHPAADLKTNTLGTLNILEKIKNNSQVKFIYASSSCVYGNKDECNEFDQEFHPETPYAISKLAGDRYVKFYRDHYGVKTVILRYFNSFGPFESPGKYRNVIPRFFYWALNGKPLIITGTGKETRDFNYVYNVVYGTILSAVFDKAIGKVYNIASGKETAIIDLAKKIKELTGKKVPIVFKDRREWDRVLKRKGNIKLITEELGYAGSKTLDEGLSYTFSWFSNHWNQIRYT